MLVVHKDSIALSVVERTVRARAYFMIHGANLCERSKNGTAKWILFLCCDVLSILYDGNLISPPLLSV